MININIATLHNPFFLAGKNFGSQLDVSKRTGLKLSYDRAEKELLVEFNGSVAIIPSSNVASMTLENPKDVGITTTSTPKAAPITHTHHPMVAGIDRAQVSDPTRDVIK
jgi:hypothetical protein